MNLNCVINLLFILGERGYTYPYELAIRGEPGIDGKYLVFIILAKDYEDSIQI